MSKIIKEGTRNPPTIIGNEIKPGSKPTQTPPLDLIFTQLRDRIDSRDPEHDDDTPPYTLMQRISSQINRAQSGEGPFKARFMDIAEIAIAAILSIRRKE